VLVTDYSSVIFEFALLGRPMVFFAPDLDAYERERGFYLDYRRDLPGPVTQSTAELVAALRAADPEADKARVAAFARRSFDIADGRATERVIMQLILPALDE
jgi:CDP-glycerol glycerophosphotransferase (TagB/SpsB family)